MFTQNSDGILNAYFILSKIISFNMLSPEAEFRIYLNEYENRPVGKEQAGSMKY
jgi:hypothetical protein